MSNPSIHAENSLVRSASSGIAWTLGGSIAHKAGTAISALILARILGPSGLGEYSLIQSTVMMFALYGSFRMGNVAIKHIAQYQASDKPKCARILRLALSASLVTCSIVALLMLAFASPIASRMLGAPHLTTEISIGAVLLFFSTYTTILQVTLTGFKNFRSSAAFSFVRGILTPILCPLLAWFWGVSGALLGLTIIAVVVMPSLIRSLSKEKQKAGLAAHVPIREAMQELQVLWTFALPGFLCLLLVTASTWLAKCWLVRIGNFEQLGLFEAAGQWCTLILFIPAILSRVMLPFLSERQKSSQTKNYRDAFALQLRITLLLTSPLAVALIVFSEVTMRLYGNAFVASAQLMPFIVGAGLLRTLNETVRLVYESKSRLWLGLLMYAGWAATLIGVTLGTVDSLAATGFAVATLLAELVLLMLNIATIEYAIMPRLFSPHLRLTLAMIALLALASIVSRFCPAPWSLIVGSGIFAASVTPTIHSFRMQLARPQTILRIAHSEILGLLRTFMARVRS